MARCLEREARDITGDLSSRHLESSWEDRLPYHKEDVMLSDIGWWKNNAMCVSGSEIQRRESFKEKESRGWGWRGRELGEAWRWEIQQLTIIKESKPMTLVEGDCQREGEIRLD